MAKKVNTTLLGIFVIGAVILALGAIALFGSGKIFENHTRYVIYFPESVRGLSIGAPVRFRGISIGTVVEMQALFEKSDNKILIPVYIEVERDRIKNLTPQAKSPEEQQANLLKVGIRAQLVTDSMVTGQRAIALDIQPKEPVRLVGADPSVAEISSVPSSIEQLSQKLESLPLDEIVQKVNNTISAIEAAVTAPEFKEGISNLGPSMIEARKVLTSISEEIKPVLSDVRVKLEQFDTAKISAQLDRSLTSIDSAAQNIATLSRSGAPLDNNANRALVEIAAASRELRQLAELLQRRPEVLLTGKK